MEKIDFLEKTLARLLDWINKVDTKITLIMAIDIAMLGILFSEAPSVSDYSTVLIICLVFSTITIFISLLFLLFSTFPITRGPDDSMIYFGKIVNKTLEEYESDLGAYQEENYIEDLIQQCHRNAEIANRKYKLLQRSLRALFVCIIPWLISLYLIFIEKKLRICPPFFIPL